MKSVENFISLAIIGNRYRIISKDVGTEEHLLKDTVAYGDVIRFIGYRLYDVPPRVMILL